MDRRTFLRNVAAVPAAAALPAAAIATAQAAAIADLPRPTSCSAPIVKRWPIGQLHQLPAAPSHPAPCFLWMTAPIYAPWREIYIRFGGLRERDIRRIELSVDNFVI